jgi:hypothetical protein
MVGYGAGPVCLPEPLPLFMRTAGYAVGTVNYLRLCPKTYCNYNPLKVTNVYVSSLKYVKLFTVTPFRVIFYENKIIGISKFVFLCRF